MNTRLPLLLLFAGLGLAGCAAFKSAPSGPVTDENAGIAEPQVQQIDPGAARPPDAARTADEFDTTSDAQKTEAQNAPSGAERALGKTIASLGSPSEAGFWLKTPLINANGPGRVVYSQTGKSVQVTLVPLPGPDTAGSQLSLAAFRVIGAPLTALPEVQVFAAQPD